MKRKIALLACGLALSAVGGAAMSQEGVLFDTDFLGSDYREVHLRPGQGYEVCARACADDQPCRAWTWVPQGAQRTEGPNCWLKNSVPEPGRLSGIVSGLKGYGVTPVSTTRPPPSGGRAGAAVEPTTGEGPADQVGRLVLYEGDNFGGRSIDLDRDTANLHIESLQFGDSTWSLAAEGRWQVCEHIDFTGECQTFEGDHATLQDWGGTISSARYLGPGASSRVLAGGRDGDSRRSRSGDRNRQPGVVETAAERAARVAAEEAERRAHERIREGIGRLF